MEMEPKHGGDGEEIYWCCSHPTLPLPAGVTHCLNKIAVRRQVNPGGAACRVQPPDTEQGRDSLKKGWRDQTKQHKD